MAGTGTISFLTVLQTRIDEMADHAGMTGAARSSLDETLAALSKASRRRLFMILESLRAFSPDPEQRAAAEAVQERAARAWGEQAEEITGEREQVAPGHTAGPLRLS
jgi:hypothetical protein